MTWLLLIWTVLIVIWVSAERFSPAAKLRRLWQHATAPITRAAHEHEPEATAQPDARQARPAPPPATVSARSRRPG